MHSVLRDESCQALRRSYTALSDSKLGHFPSFHYIQSSTKKPAKFSNNHFDRRQFTCQRPLAKMIEKRDAVRATWGDTQRIAARSHAIWSLCAEQSSTKNELPAECIQLQNALGRVPAYLADRLADPALLKIEQKDARDDKTELFVGGTLTWRTSSGDCDTGVKSLHHYLLLGMQNSILCDFTRDSRFIIWPQVQKEERNAGESNYLAILIFAWAYILSARLIEMQQVNGSSLGCDNIRYSQVQARSLCDRLADSSDMLNKQLTA